MNFSKQLIQWYLQNKRDLPWRKTTQPYHIWLSEIMLQQTRVAQGLPYFLKFTEAFPTVQHLAEAPQEQVLKLWQGLGYYSRARNLHETAKYVAFSHNGVFPENYNGLLKLKGVGEYTAAAIASICYGEAVPVVDGNVYRVLSRYFGIETDISSGSAKKQFTALAASQMPPGSASDFNQAMMEFGALQCIPKNPDCASCVLNAGCVAYQTGKVNMLPVKLKKTKVTSRYFNYLIIKDKNNNSIIQKRTGKGIWHNLYEFPLLETEAETTIAETIKLIQDFLPPHIRPVSIRLVTTGPMIHKLSHQHLNIRFWEITVDTVLPEAMDIETIKAYPFPIVLYNFIEQNWE
ncbi:A/G-specific adenine glycosylase [Flavobacterium sp. MK4S-17]|uniref:A/G-specific adenine glycosylase n=1 Tax=Flavobacterium sp. MK4S-17 TaxID=2543737 RepID=UPI0013572C5F|nr:A/G-specific adenine glycosylase [Flavobacterium sp. MK4S-17]